MTGVTATPIAPREIDSDAFAPFGQLLEAPGEGSRMDFAGAVGNGRQDARPNLALIRARPVSDRYRLTELERHPYSSQAFFPLDVDRYLVIVCRDDGTGSRTFRAWSRSWSKERRPSTTTSEPGITGW